MFFGHGPVTMAPTQVRTWEGGHVRRLTLVISAGFLALGLVSLSSLSAAAETSDEQQPTGGTATLQTNTDASGFISQGSAIDSDSPELAAVRADIAEEDRLPDYSQVVDNDTGGRFSAPGWEKRSNSQDVDAGQLSHGGNYLVSGSSRKAASFKVSIPTSSDYTVYAWWPAYSGSSQAAHFGIDTASGKQWTAVDQSTDGGIWIKLGTYAMKKGERFIRVSAGSPDTGKSVADAVAVVRGNVTMPPGEGGVTARSGVTTFSADSRRDPNGHDVIRVAERYLGIGYRYGTCTRYAMSCTCETKRTYRHFGHKLTMVERQQWRYDRSRKVRHKSNLHLGDEVFFREHGGPITHVAIYSGNGNVVHASSYYGKVVESKMKYISGYTGARRYRLH
jgi:cell wall-associated NlpC family hydrolase